MKICSHFLCKHNCQKYFHPFRTDQNQLMELELACIKKKWHEADEGIGVKSWFSNFLTFF